MCARYNSFTHTNVQCTCIHVHVVYNCVRYKGLGSSTCMYTCIYNCIIIFTVLFLPFHSPTPLLSLPPSPSPQDNDLLFADIAALHSEILLVSQNSRQLYRYRLQIASSLHHRNYIIITSYTTVGHVMRRCWYQSHTH